MSKQMQNTVVVGMDEMAEIVEENFNAKQNVMFYGSPGVGKTSIITQTAQKMAADRGLNFVYQPTAAEWANPANFCLSVIIISQIDELDVKGLPNIVHQADGTSTTTFTTTDMFPEHGQGIIFLDEFGNGQQHVMNAFQPILNEHTAGNTKISKDISFVLASNKVTDNSNVKPLPSALKSRMCTYEVALQEVQDWTKAMTASGMKIDKRIEAFLLTMPRYFYNFDPSKSATNGYGCPRSHHRVSEMIKDVDDLKKLSRIYGSWAGRDIGDAFRSFVKLAETVDIADLMNHPEKISQHEDDIGKLYSICIALVDKAVKSKEAAAKVFRIMDSMSRDEFGLYIFNSMLGEMGKNKLTTLARADPKNAKLMLRYSQLFMD
jgi:DNA polymerase III delta prime subunit